MCAEFDGVLEPGAGERRGHSVTLFGYRVLKRGEGIV